MRPTALFFFALWLACAPLLYEAFALQFGWPTISHHVRVLRLNQPVLYDVGLYVAGGVTLWLILHFSHAPSILGLK